MLLTLSSKSLDDVGKLDSLLAAEWVISFGTLAMLLGNEEISNSAKASFVLLHESQREVV